MSFLSSSHQFSLCGPEIKLHLYAPNSNIWFVWPHYASGTQTSSGNNFTFFIYVQNILDCVRVQITSYSKIVPCNQLLETVHMEK